MVKQEIPSAVIPSHSIRSINAHLCIDVSYVCKEGTLMKHLFFCTTLLALFLLAGCADSATPPQGSAAPYIPPAIPTATPMPSPTPSPTPTPTPTPTQPPVQQSVQQPAQQSAPPPATGVNGNPWGYDFNPGNYITAPPSAFCSYFNCIASFWNGKGHVEECNDATYSKSGGISGSCSSHGGNWRPLYSH